MRISTQGTGPSITEKERRDPVAAPAYLHRQHAVTAGLLLTLSLVPLPSLAQVAATPTGSGAKQGAPDDNWLMTQIRQFRAYPHLHRAYRLQEKKQLSDAAAEMQAYLSLEPRDQTVQLNYLNLLLQLKDAKGVLQHTERLLVEAPQNPTYLLYQGLALHAAGNDTLAASRLRTVYSAPAAGSANRIIAASAAVEIHMEKHQFQQALLDLTVLAELQNNYFVHSRRGTALRALDNVDEAELAFKNALTQAKTPREKIETLSALGYLAQRKNNVAEAVQYGQAVLSHDPRNLDWLRMLAELHVTQKDLAGAENMARRALGATNAIKDRVYLANILAERKNYPDAIEQYEVVAHDTTDPKFAFHARMGIGYSYQALGNRAAAHDAFALAAHIMPSPEALAASAETTPQSATANLAQAPVRRDLAGLLAAYQHHPDADTAASIGYLYAEKKDPANAARYLQKALLVKALPEWRLSLAELYAELADMPSARATIAAFVPRSPEQWRRVAELHVRTGDKALATSALARIATNAEDHLQLAQQYTDAHQTERALAELQLALHSDPAALQRQQAWRETGYLQLEQGNVMLAIAALQSAVDAGDNSPAIRRELAYLFEKKQDFGSALNHFLRVLAVENTPQNMIDVGRMYAATKQPAQAIRFYESARADADRLDAEARVAVDAELGMLYSEAGQFDRAEQVWQSAATAKPTPEVQLQLAYAQEMRGKLPQALAMLNAIAQTGADQSLRLQVLDQTGRVAEKAGQLDTAVKALEQANALAPSAERHSQMGQIASKQKHNASARAHMESAVQLAPDNLDYLQQLGYLCKDQGDLRCAVRAFEQVLTQDPKRVALYQDMAYAYTQAGENDKAIVWFKKSIDNKNSVRISQVLRSYLVVPESENASATPAADGATDAQQVYAMRQQVAELARRYQINAYQSYRARSSRRANSNATPGLFTSGALLPSQGGLEFVYQPPGIGYQDGKTFRIIARTLWANRPDSLSIDSTTVQGGLGIEYKPFRETDAYLSLDRQIKIGSQSENNWMLRGSWGYSDGYGMQPNQRSWNQTILYTDIGFALQHEKIRSASAELRQGRAFNFNNTTMVTPHLSAGARKQWPDPSDTSHVDIGAGVSVKYLFNETRYETARSNGEFTLQYRKQVSNQHEGGWVFTGAFQF